MDPSSAKPVKGSPWLRELYELFAPVRARLEGYTEKEINDAIAEAVKEVRKVHREPGSPDSRALESD